MSEDRELQAKIAALSGRINLHKQQQQQHQPAQDYRPPSSNGYGHGSAWFPQRGTPYGRPRGRGNTAMSPVHRHRTLVLNNGNGATTHNMQHAESGLTGNPGTHSPATAQTWVSKRDRHMQLINTSVYDQLSQQRTREMEESLKQRQQQRDMKERAKLNRHFHCMDVKHPAVAGSRSGYSSPRVHELVIENIRFRVADGGSKLVRAANEPGSAKTTPKSVRIGGVTFFRSKHGNLYRSGLVKSRKSRMVKKSPELCPKFTSTGTCPKGPFCRFVHDPNKVAICKEYLQKGSCPAGDACDLSHDPTPHRVPACVHFLRGNCTNDNCRYAHVRVNPGAPVCRAFAILGYCEKGADCAERHIYECPDYANKGLCRSKKCRLPHVDRAGQIRKATAAAQSANPSDDDNSPDLSSDEDDLEEIDSDDVDSDGLDEDVIMQGIDDTSDHELLQQQDFVRF